jgi:UDP-N-acetylglucosamine diphosphorylase/glucosamine-1-phosphate N-acetyltransferase
MKNLILFDNERRDSFLPLTYTRPTCELRIGLFTITEKWSIWLKGQSSYITQDYLSQKFPISIKEENYVINGSVLPNEQLVRLINQLDYNEALMKGEELIAVRLDDGQFENLLENDDLDELIGYQLTETPLHQVTKLSDIFQFNGQQLRSDIQKMTELRTSAEIPNHTTAVKPKNIFIEKSAAIDPGVILNASEGPIYIGRNSKIMEGGIIRGPFGLCENSVIKMGAKIYSNSTIGPFSKVGGEINNCVFIGYSNKAHDGFLGNSVIGEWCNIGADTNNSNLKNNYQNVKIWNYPKKKFVDTETQFCGLFMGDHSKCGINTMFNTGTVVGVHANIFGGGFPRTFIPSFSWGGHSGWKTYHFDKAMETAQIVMKRRAQSLTPDDRDMYSYLFDKTLEYRTWEKSPSGKKS